MNNKIKHKNMVSSLIIIVLLMSPACSLRRQTIVERKAEAADLIGKAEQKAAIAAANAPYLTSIPHGKLIVPEHGIKAELTENDAPSARMLADVPGPQAKKAHKKTRIISLDDRMVKIDFENEELATMINHFAAVQKRNIVLPLGAQALTQKITFKLAQEIPLREVDRYLDMFLDFAGYSRVPHGIVQRIVPNDAAVVREALPLYVGVDPKDLPNSDERIRAIYYLKNLHVPDNETGTEPITAILTSMLSGSRSITYDPRANALIVADKSNSIRAAITLILELDSLGSKDTIRAVPLYNSSAAMVAELITRQILAAMGDEQAGIKSDVGRYFSAGVKVVPDFRTNSLILMGREPAVERLQDFVREYVDVAPDMGTSVLHSYDLQYLDAEKFAPVLQAIVKEQQLLGSGQSTQQMGGGPVRVFQNVVIVPERVVAERIEAGRLAVAGDSKTATSAAVLEGAVYRGGNRIIITALRDDWKRIEALIRDLDQPQLQVLVQVLIVDIDATNNNQLATQLRNPSWMQLPNGFAFQSAQLVNPILNGPISGTTPPFTYSDPTTVAADLLRILSGNLSAAAQIVNVTGNTGSMIVSFNDSSAATPGIWAFMQWLEKFFTTKVLQHPYIVVQNFGRGEEYISDIRRVPGPATTGEGGAIAVKIEDIPAAVRIAVVPRASSVDRLNLQISITIDQFEGTSANRVTRQIHTNVNMDSGNMLVLGGLTSYQELYTESETPILGSIPIIKWFFSNTERNLRRSNLVAFVSPTIIEPRMPEGMAAFTKAETHRNYKAMKQDELLSQLKEPISYLFFNDRNDNLADMLDQYMATGKGDFVYDDIGVVPGYSSHKCDPCKKVAELDDPQDIDNADAAARIKQQLALEENPLLAAHRRVGGEVDVIRTGTICAKPTGTKSCRR